MLDGQEHGPNSRIENQPHTWLQSKRAEWGELDWPAAPATVHGWSIPHLQLLPLANIIPNESTHFQYELRSLFPCLRYFGNIGELPVTFQIPFTLTMGGEIIIAVGQMCSTSSMRHNLGQVQALVKKAVAAGAQALFLPEASDYIGRSASETLSLCESVEESEYVLGLQKEAETHKIAINVGIHEPSLHKGSKKIRNTSIWISADGVITQRYQKLHLFDMDIKNGPRARESDTFEEGMEILPPFQTPVGRVGLMICFDLRYPEVPLSLKRQGAQIITYPSAFTVPTGKAHWEILLRARAIETQSYVIAAAQAGHNNEMRVTYGHSIVVDPWGNIVTELGGDFEGPQIATATIDLSLVEKIRKEVPLVRRTDVYPEL